MLPLSLLSTSLQPLSFPPHSSRPLLVPAPTSGRRCSEISASAPRHAPNQPCIVNNHHPATCEDQLAFDQLAEWVVLEGGFVGKVSVKTVNGLRGLYVREDVKAGEPLLAVPSQCMLFACDGDATCKEEQHLKLHERLMFRLLTAAATGDKALYRATMPRSVPLLRDWSDTDLLELQSDELCAAVWSQREHLRRTCERVLCAWAQRHPTLSPPTSEQLHWAESIVRSRSLASAEGMDRAMMLVPLFDLCNHKAQSPRGDGSEHQPPVLLTSDGVVVLCSRNDLKLGEEVHIEYCDEGNWGLLRDYGFTMPVGRTGQDASIEELHIGGAAQLVIGSPELDRVAVRRAQEELCSILFSEREDSAAGALRREAETIAAVRDACAAALLQKPTSEAQDAVELDALGTTCGDTRTQRKLDALRIRLGHKKKLRRAVQELEAAHTSCVTLMREASTSTLISSTTPDYSTYEMAHYGRHALEALERSRSEYAP